MAHDSLVQNLALVGLTLPLPLFAVAVQQYRGSPFGAVLSLLSAALVFGVATVLVDAFPLSPAAGRAVTLAFVGVAAALSAAGAIQVARMTTGRCSV